MGNIAEDRTEAGWRPGGPALFAARTALSLGWHVTLATSLPDSYDRTALQGIGLVALPALGPTRFENQYTPAGRRQRLLAAGPPLHLPAGALSGRPPLDALLLAPAFDELQTFRQPPAPLVGVALQGQLRSAGADGLVLPRQDATSAALVLVRKGHLAFFSDEDTADAGALARVLVREGATVLVTHGARGATLYRAAGTEHFPALTSPEVDPTGAGDCFSAAVLLRFAETSDLREAVRWGLAAGALAVRAPGLAGVPARAAIEELLAEIEV